MFDILANHSSISKSLTLRVGPKVISIVAGNVPDDEFPEPLIWFSPDKLLMHFSRGEIDVRGLNDVRPFWEFDLLYVGISKATDSLSRLFDTGHEARTAILSTRGQIEPTARLTDEVMVLLFTVDPVQLIEYEFDAFANGATLGSIEVPANDALLAADAEKAFVSSLKPEYNNLLYEKYPLGKDSLHKKGLNLYSYGVGDDLTLKTPTTKFRGEFPLGCDSIISVDKSANMIAGSPRSRGRLKLSSD
jgi:hypothetical protein